MKFKGLLFLTAIAAVCPLVWAAQTGEEYVDQTSKFKLMLMGDWRAVSYNDAVGRQKTEFVYRDRSEGLLKISKEGLSGSVADLIREEEQSLTISLSGFERAASESFGGGSLTGMRFSFYNTRGGRQVANTYYYLKDGNSVWVLRFSGRRGTLDAIRNVTDQIARSFRPM
jgi:hypothetical protein